MSVDVRAHIEPNSSYERRRAVLRNLRIYSDGIMRKAVAIEPAGDQAHIMLADLGDALRALKISATDLGYNKPAKRR